MNYDLVQETTQWNFESSFPLDVLDLDFCCFVVDYDSICILYRNIYFHTEHTPLLISKACQDACDLPLQGSSLTVVSPHFFLLLCNLR